MAVDADWISRWRLQVTAFLTAMNALHALGTQYISLDYGSSLDPVEDFVGHPDITKEDLIATVSSVQAIEGFVSSGHSTNLYRLVI